MRTTPVVPTPSRPEPGRVDSARPSVSTVRGDRHPAGIVRPGSGPFDRRHGERCLPLPTRPAYRDGWEEVRPSLWSTGQCGGGTWLATQREMYSLFPTHRPATTCWTSGTFLRGYPLYSVPAVVTGGQWSREGYADEVYDGSYAYADTVPSAAVPQYSYPYSTEYSPPAPGYAQPDVPVENAVPAETAVPSDPAVVDRRGEGLRAFQARDYAEARRQLVQALLLDEDNAELLMLYGYAHFATGDYLVATLAIRRALTADPTLIDYPVDLTALYVDPQELAGHVHRLDEHLASDPQDADAWFLAGFVRYAALQPAAAAEVFAERAQLQPDDLLLALMRDAAMRASVVMEAAARDTTAPRPEEAPVIPESSPSDLGDSALPPESL